MANQREFWHQKQFIWFDSDLLPDLTHDYFVGQYWQSNGSLVGSSVGRGTAYFFRQHQNEFVLRHYLRGGLIGKLLEDHYLYTGLNNTRAMQEKNLLQHLLALQLPAPTPAAIRVCKQGLFYQADLITVKIPNATDAHHILQKAPLSTDIWHAMGITIARFHQQQIFHHDLNIHNIMIDDHHNVWLIDFDKCAVKQGQDWKQQNLQRLLRSLQKESAKNTGYAFGQSDWQYLLAGYANIA